MKVSAALKMRSINFDDRVPLAVTRPSRENVIETGALQIVGTAELCQVGDSLLVAVLIRQHVSGSFHWCE